MKTIKYIFLLFVFAGFFSRAFSFDNVSAGNLFFFQDSIIIKDTSLVVDTAKIADSLEVKTIVDTLTPINNRSLSEDSFHYILLRNQIEELNYKGAGDLFEYLPFGFNQNLGSPGQPNEIFLYGSGFGDISYSMDGIPLNYRITNSFDLNLISPEIIDSLELLPLTSGFLYNNFNNPVTLNFLTKDKIAARPYTRIRYFQAPDEGFIDGMFNVYLMSRLNLFLNFTNRTYDDDGNYANSYSNSWKANVRLRYLLSKNISLVGTYNYAKSETGLFGGIDEDFTPDSQFFIPRGADVNFANRYQKKRRNNFDIKILSRLLNNAPTELKFYYQFALNEFRLNENVEIDSTQARIKNNNKYNLGGIYFRQKLKLSFLKIDFISNYELIDPQVDFTGRINSFSTFSNSVRIEVPVGKLKPSAFAKILNYNGENLTGYGFEMNYEPLQNFQMFAGYSEYDRSFSPSVIINSYRRNSSFLVARFKNIQFGLKLKNNFFEGSASFIKIENERSPIGVSFSSNQNVFGVDEIFFQDESYSGINTNSILRFLVFEFRLNGTYYFDRREFRKTFPSENLNAGVYYVNNHFNSNLNLKTGFDFRYYGEQVYRYYDFERNAPVLLIADNADSFAASTAEFTDPVFVMDYFLSGRIQERAVIYFSVENILDNNYYIVPVYPAQGRSIKFGFTWEFLD